MVEICSFVAVPYAAGFVLHFVLPPSEKQLKSVLFRLDFHGFGGFQV